jgi:hypothetical protein
MRRPPVLVRGTELGASVLYIFTYIYIYKDIGKPAIVHPYAPVSPTTMSWGLRA